MSDLELLQTYTEQRAEDAFSQLVDRYLNLVYSAALRQVRSAHLAEEITQTVFTDLAKNAHKFAPGTVLSAWLYEVTRRTAIDFIRKEARRLNREQIAAAMSNSQEDSECWRHIEPFLDEALARLPRQDRAAVLLRYFEQRPHREIGEALGISAGAAQKRVERALEELRGILCGRGIQIGAPALAAVISGHAVQAAPFGLAAVVCANTAELARSAVSLSFVKGVTMTAAQKTFVVAGLAAALGTAVYESTKASRLEHRVSAQEIRERELKQQVDELSRARDDASAKAGALQQENARLRRDASDALRLRDEVTRLRANAPDPTQVPRGAGLSPVEATAREWANRATQLRAWLQRMPDKGIPELSLIDQSAWLDAAKSADVYSDDGVRQALRDLRERAKDVFAKKLRAALTAYTRNNDNLLPSDLSQLKPYFDVPIDDSILERYSLVKQGKLTSPNEILVQEIGPAVDEEYDTRREIGLTAGSTGPNNQILEAVLTAAQEFAKAHRGQIPQQPSDLAAYLKRTIPEVKLQKYLKELPPELLTVPAPRLP